MIKILKHAQVLAPDSLGQQDVLLLADRIGAIAPEINPPTGAAWQVEVYDCRGKYLVPGFIDGHVHLIGGGGEAGYYSRTPEINLSGILRSGITTVVGLLGTDGTARHLSALLAKARALEMEGVSSFIYTGSFEVPAVTISGSVRSDIMLIDKVIGTGEIAISDHRSSQPTQDELTRIAADSRLGGMLSGKAGIVHLHVGVGKHRLDMLHNIAEASEVPLAQFVPTHVNRSEELLEAAIRFAKAGGTIDITSGVSPEMGFTTAVKPSTAVRLCLEQGVPVERITMSSDGNGSMAVYDANGTVDRLLITTLESLAVELRDMVVLEGIPLAVAVQTITSSVARILRLWPEKGSITPGRAADLTVLDTDLQVTGVIARGKTLLWDDQLLARGTFE